MQTCSFEPGQIILEEGEPSDAAYIINSGRVEIFKNTPAGPVCLAILGEGDVFGEMGLLDERPRSATARAAEPVAASVVSRDDFTHQLLHEPNLALVMLRSLFERLRAMNLRIMTQVSTNPEAAVASPPAVPQVRLLPLTAETQTALPVEGIEVNRFPFRIGRRPSGEESGVLALNEVQLDDREPYRLSLNHFSLELGEGGVLVRDRGSRQQTIADDIVLGAGALRDDLPLGFGPHEVIAGPPDSPFRFRVTVKPGGAVAGS